MKILLIISFFFNYHIIYSQQEKLEVEGAIQISNSTDPSPDLGTIRWTGADFEGWNGIVWVSLTGGIKVGSVTDAAGQTYKTVNIGGQVWMAENLRTFKYNDNSSITLITNQTTWSGLSTGAWTSYNNDPGTYDIPYGKLYNWFAVETGKLCPTGWDVPTDLEWSTLIDFLGGIGLAGGKLKEKGAVHWLGENVGATNSSAFNGIPGGFRDDDGTFLLFGNRAFYWSSTPSGSNAWDRYISTYDDDANRFNRDKNAGLSVRCIKK
jgi:uncharacterized protein (TIGR02145 family)